MGMRLRGGLLAALLLCSAVAYAQPTPPDREAERTALYEEGVKLAEAGRWQEAVDRFEQVVAIRSAPRARFTLGQAQEKLGKLASAKASYQASLTEAQAVADPDAAGAAGGALAAIAKRVPSVQLVLPVDVRDVVVTVDAKQLTYTGEPIDLDPGVHRLAVYATGRQPFERDVTAAEGTATEVVVQYAAPAPPVGPADQPPGQGGSAASREGDSTAEEASSGPSAGVWVLGATGIVAAAVGVALYATGQSAYDDAASLCEAEQCPTADTADDGNGARTRMIVGDVLMGVGGAALAGALLWWALAPSSAQGAEGARVGLTLTPTTVGLSLGGAL